MIKPTSSEMEDGSIREIENREGTRKQEDPAPGPGILSSAGVERHILLLPLPRRQGNPQKSPATTESGALSHSRPETRFTMKESHRHNGSRKGEPT